MSWFFCVRETSKAKQRGGGAPARQLAATTQTPKASTTTTRQRRRTSCTETEWQWPSSWAVGPVSTGSAVAPVARHSLRRSNLELSLTTSSPYWLQKCMPRSPTLPPVTITLAPLSLMALILASRTPSSSLLYDLSSAAVLRRTVPCHETEKGEEIEVGSG